MTLAVEFVGHSTLRIDIDGVRLLTDPVTRSRIGPLRRIVPPPDPSRLTGIDALLVSHLHWDHLDLPSLRRLPEGIPLVVPAGAAGWLRGSGFDDVRGVLVGDTIEVGGMTIEVVPALHSGFRPPRGPTATAVGYVMRGTRSVYFAGDTDIFDAMARLGHVDLALLPVWGWGPVLGRGRHLDPWRAAEALRLIRPRGVVPIHWGTYWPQAMGRVYPMRLIEPPAAFVEYAAELAPDVRTLPTAVGDEVELPPW